MAAKATAFSVGRQPSHIIAPGMSTRLLMMRKAGPFAVRRTRANGHPQAVWPSSFERAKWTHAVTVFILTMRWSVRAKPVARATTSCACESNSLRSYSREFSSARRRLVITAECCGEAALAEDDGNATQAGRLAEDSPRSVRSERSGASAT